MFKVRARNVTRLARGAALAAVILFVTSASVFAQAGTATIRGTVEDTSGGVLPGATITVTNHGTKAVVNSVTDDRGGYLVVVFPGTYDIKVELAGFKTYEQKGVSISARATTAVSTCSSRSAQQTETVTVTAQQEVIQTETGAREGVLTRSRSTTCRSWAEARSSCCASCPASSSIQHRRVGGRRQQHAELHGQRHPLVTQHRARSTART